jgi:subtilisin family serine protease
VISFAIAALAAGMLATIPSAAAGGEERYIVIYGSSSQVHQDQVRARGAEVQGDLSKAGLLAVKTSHPEALKSLPGVRGVAKDRVRFQIPKEQVTPFQEGSSDSGGCASTEASCPLQWDLARIHVPDAWNQTMGSANVKVAVLDTGVTSSHEAVGSNYDKAESRSFVTPLYDRLGVPFCLGDVATSNSIEDFNGHGTWTATHVAGANGAWMTGIAPRSTLVNVRVLGACGFGLDSWVMQGMLYGSDIGARVESMSLGGYMCGHGVVKGSVYCGNIDDVGTDPLLWDAYNQVVRYLRSKGTLVVAAAGNDHVHLDASGQVVSHGTLAGQVPFPDLSNDYFGLTEAPGGVPGVVAVAAVNRMTAEGDDGETKYGQFGVGRKDQLTYYSSYGERIDVSAPGGARNYNVPRFECLSDNCIRLGRSARGATDNPGDFGAYGVDVNGDLCSNCYAFIQGTSMATPQVAGVAVLALSANPSLSPTSLATLLRRSVTSFTNRNATPGIEQDVSMPTFNFSLAYGQPGIPNGLMGRGVIDAAKAVGAGVNNQNR